MVPVTGPLHQRVQEVAAGAAVAARPARALDLRHGARSARDDRLHGAVGDAAAETEDHARGLRGAAGGSIIQVAVRSILGP
jgi:hypothetical protein